MFSIITGTIILGIIHAFIPNHWLPLVAIAKAESWPRSELTLIACLTACAHVLGTVLLGVVLGLIGKELSEQYAGYLHLISPLLLIIFGLVYFSMNTPHHHHPASKDVQEFRRTRKKWIALFILMMFLSPCLEVESLFLAAGAYGWEGILLLALVYASISVTGIVTLVLLAFKGIQIIDAHFIEKNEKRITGLILIIVGVITFFIH